MSAEQSLRRLQALVRQSAPQPPSRTVLTRVVPDDLATEDTRTLFLLPEEREAFERAKRDVIEDVRFEYMEDADDEVWRFLCKSVIERGIDHVREFVAVHARDPLEVTCYIPVEHLRVNEERSIGGLLFLPTNDPRLPAPEHGFSLDAVVGCVAAVACRGTNYKRMAERAHEEAAQVLRVLRIALREHRMIAQPQLRFRLATSYSIGERLAGWRRRADEGWELGLSDELLNLAAEQPVSALPLVASNDLERKAHLAMSWMERAWLSSEPLPALLFLFFALEALIGDKSEGRKAEGLAIRQAMLDHAVSGRFTHPTKIYFLYDAVRSAAVHGEPAPDVGWDDVSSFAWNVRRTLNHALAFAQEHGLTRRSRLLNALDTHDDLKGLLEWLVNADPERWQVYCEQRLAQMP